MASFDKAAYKKELNTWSKDKALLKELKSIAEQLQMKPSSTAYASVDLVKLYAVDTAWGTDELVRHRSDLVSVFNGISRKPIIDGALRAIYDVLVDSSKFDDPSFWSGLSALREQEVAQKRDDIVRNLLADPSMAYKAISRKQLHESLTAQGISSSDFKYCEQALEQNGITIFDGKYAEEAESFSVPISIASSWKDARNKGTFSNIFDVLLLHVPREKRRQITFYSKLSYDDTSITLDTINKADHKATTVSDSNEVQIAHKILASFKNEVKNETELRLVVFKIFEDLVEKKLQKGGLGTGIAITRELVDLGIASSDANILLSLLASTGGGQRIDGLGRTEEHLQNGELGSAQLVFNSVDSGSTDSDEYSRVQKLLEAQIAKKKQLLEAYTAALATKKLEEARQSIAEAIRLDTEDSSLIGKLEAIPPAPAGRLTASISENGAVLSWVKSASADVLYTVVRKTGTASSNPVDGEVIAQNVETLIAEDKKPLIAQTIFYTVFAQRAGQFSEAVSAKVEIYPQPSNLTLQANSSTSVYASWNVAREASSVAVEVFDARGNAIHHATTSDTSLLLERLTTGEKYTVKVTANYITPTGVLTSPAVQASAVPRDKVTPIKGVDHITNNSEIQLDWPSVPAGFYVEVWVLPLYDNGIDFGDVVTAEQLMSMGGRRADLVAQKEIEGRTFYAVKAHRGILRVYPLILVDSGYLVGDYVSSGVIESAKNVTVEYFNDTIKLAWEWTGETRQMELTWLDAQGYPQREIVTLASYRRNGGAVIQGRNISELTIAAATKVDGETIVSAPAAIPLKQENKIEISYEQKIKGGGFFSKPSTTITARNMSGRPGSVPVNLCLSLNPYVPLNANGCIVLDRFVLDFSTNDVVTYTFEIPKTAIPNRTPQFWLVLFPQDPASVKINQPHTGQLKG